MSSVAPDRTVHLVNMPFADIISPSLALGLVKAMLAGAGMAPRVFDRNLALSADMGHKPYRRLALSNVPISEWLFAAAAFDDRPALSTVEELLGEYGFAPEDSPAWRQQSAWLQEWRNAGVPRWLDATVDALAAHGEPRVVGFSCTFFQTVPALALGRWIKRRYPKAQLVYGGASFHDEVGEELLRGVPWVDVVCTGEGEDVIVPLFEALLDGRPPEGLAGVHRRDGDGIVRLGPPPGAASDEAFAAAPRPDFDEFFATAGELRLDADPGWRREAVIPFESSRGCWWGEKAHCTFCGLNGTGMAYRRKPSEAVHGGLADYLARYPARRLHAADNLIAMASFRDLLPALAQTPLGEGVEVFFHVKSNFNRRQLAQLAAAGVTDVGPGIESLSSHLLELMRKGVSALQNVFFLKVCVELGLKPRWTNLIRVPGERAEDYALMATWIGKVPHLSPPSGAGEIQLHRFSPYHFEDRGWVSAVRPHGAYRALYPDDTLDLSRVAYTFEGEWADCLPSEARAEVVSATERWRQRWMDPAGPPRFELQVRPDGTFHLVDTRGGSLRQVVLSADECTVYRAMADPVAERRLLERARALDPALAVSEVMALAAALVERGDALEENGRYLALASDFTGSANVFAAGTTPALPVAVSDAAD